MVPLWLVGLLAAAFAVVAQYVYASRREDRQLSHIPTHTFEEGGDHNSRYLSDLKTLLESGYRRYNVHGQAFKVKIPLGGYSVKYRVVLPKDHLEEIKHLSNNVFSWQLASRIIFAQDYTGAPDRGPWSGKALRVGIHQNLGDITTHTDAALSDLMSRELPRDANSVISIPMMDFFVRIIGTVTNQRLVDPRLAKDPQWVRESCDFAVSRYAAADEVRKWPPLLSKVVAPFLPSVRQLRKSRAYNREMMKPLYNELQSQLSADGKPSRNKGALGFEWLWSGSPAGVSLDDFADTMMRTLIASIHTTAKTVTVAFIDLLTQPEYYHELVKEAQAAVDPDGKNVQLDKLFKLDCFLKESQRLTPVFLCRCAAAIITHCQLLTSSSDHEPHPHSAVRLQVRFYDSSAGLHDKRRLRGHRHRPYNFQRPQHVRRRPLPTYEGGSQGVGELSGHGHVNNRLSRLRPRKPSVPRPLFRREQHEAHHGQTADAV